MPLLLQPSKIWLLPCGHKSGRAREVAVAVIWEPVSYFTCGAFSINCVRLGQQCRLAALEGERASSFGNMLKATRCSDCAMPTPG